VRSQRSVAGWVRSVILTGVSSHPSCAQWRGTIALILWGLINSPLVGLWQTAEHTRALVACVVVLRSPLTHSYLIVFIQLSEWVILVWLHHEVASSGTRWSCCKPVVLVTLGGWHLLDSLVACDSVEACEKVMRCSREGFMREIVLVPRGSRRATLVECVIEIPSLSR
jgi:hypothetical protein